MKVVATIGLDIAKQVFQVHGADKSGRPVLRRKLRRAEVARFFSEVPPCLIGIEASGSAHYWARVLGGFGHTVRLMAPQFVKPYVKSQKNDANEDSLLSGFGRQLLGDLYEELCVRLPHPSDGRTDSPNPPQQRPVSEDRYHRRRGAGDCHRSVAAIAGSRAFHNGR